MSEMNMTKERIFISISITYKINIKLTDQHECTTDIGMNAQHKSSF